MQPACVPFGRRTKAMVPQSYTDSGGSHPRQPSNRRCQNAFKEAVTPPAKCRCNARCGLRRAHALIPGPRHARASSVITGYGKYCFSSVNLFITDNPLTSSPDRRCRPLPPGVQSGFFLPDRHSAEALPVFRFPEPALRLCPFCLFRPETRRSYGCTGASASSSLEMTHTRLTAPRKPFSRCGHLFRHRCHKRLLPAPNRISPRLRRCHHRMHSFPGKRRDLSPPPLPGQQLRLIKAVQIPDRLAKLSLRRADIHLHDFFSGSLSDVFNQNGKFCFHTVRSCIQNLHGKIRIRQTKAEGIAYFFPLQRFQNNGSQRKYPLHTHCIQHLQNDP